MKVELKLLQKEIGTTFIYITHDQSEALVMSDKIAVMHQGKFEQIDTPRNLYKNPKTAFVASFVGDSNRFGLASQSKETVKTQGGWEINLAQETKVTELFIRPEAVILYPSSDDKAINVFEVKIKTILFDGSNTKLSTIVNNSQEELLISLPQNAQFENLQEGDVIPVGVHSDDLKCY